MEERIKFLGALSTQVPAVWVGVAKIWSSQSSCPGRPFLSLTRSHSATHCVAYEGMHRTMLRINAAVVGLLHAAFYNPVWTSAIGSVLAAAVATSFGVG